MSSKVSPIVMIIFFLLILFTIFSIWKRYQKELQLPPFDTGREVEVIKLPALPTSTSTPKPLTFNQMNNLYGPCVFLPTLMYHHIQDPIKAKENHQVSLSVDTEVFRKQIQYLKDRGYNSVSFSDVVSFFDQGKTIPQKSILITFDDGYTDFYSQAFPILKELGFKTSVFLSTGLMNNFGYLNWSEVTDVSGSGIFFGNHTWSHKNVGHEGSVFEKELTTADTQLSERNLNSPKVFAYPYGFSNSFSKAILLKLGYKLAFTTRPGSILCEKQRFDLPRIRVGNNSLSNYGL